MSRHWEWWAVVVFYIVLALWLYATGRHRAVIWETKRDVRWAAFMRVFFLACFLYPIFMRDAGPLLIQTWPAGSSWIRIVPWIGWAAWGFALIGYKPRQSMIVLLLYVLFASSHFYALAPMWQFHFIEYMTAAMLFLPLGESHPNGWFKVPQIILALFYGLAGLGKLEVSGLSWADGETIRGFMMLRLLDVGRVGLTPFQSWVATHDSFCRLFQVVVLGMELIFPCALIWPRLLWALLPMAFIFHAIVPALFGFSFPLWILFVIFIDPIPHLNVIKRVRIILPKILDKAPPLQR